MSKLKVGDKLVVRDESRSREVKVGDIFTVNSFLYYNSDSESYHIISHNSDLLVRVYDDGKIEATGVGILFKKAKEKNLSSLEPN